MTVESHELLQRVNKYIGHAHHVYTTTHKEYRQNIIYEQKLDRIIFCKNTIKGINQFSGLQNICRLILVVRKPLREILPNEANSSYEHSLQEYNKIISYCEEILKMVNSLR